MILLVRLLTIKTKLSSDVLLILERISPEGYGLRHQNCFVLHYKSLDSVLCLLVAWYSIGQVEEKEAIITLEGFNLSCCGRKTEELRPKTFEIVVGI